MSDRPEHCDRCRFWEAFTPGVGHHAPGKEGRCHRFPPALEADGANEENASMSAGRWAFPATFGDDWCGEFRPSGVPVSAPAPPGAPPDFLDAYLEDCPNLPHRYANKLARHFGAKTVRQLVGLTRDQIRGTRGLGPGTLYTVAEFLNAHGLKLREANP